MAYATDTRSATRGTTLTDRFNALRASLAERRAQRRVFVATRDELCALSNRELADLGLARCEITRIAMEAAYGT